MPLYILALFTATFLYGCAYRVKEVYIPTKCNVPEHTKPKRGATQDYTEFQAELRAYYKAVEDDLHFCRTGQKRD